MTGRLARGRLKEELASELLSRLAAETEGDSRPAVESRAAIRIVSNGLGRPELYIGEEKGPAISFSYSSDTIWAVICAAVAGLGIDAADASEFDGAYPFHRVFLEDELSMALEMCHGSLTESAALLWSVKEATLKALGCGFHLLDPLQLFIYGTVRVQEGLECYVRLTEEAQHRFPKPIDEGFPVSIARCGKTWVSIAAISERASALGRDCPETAKSLNACEVYAAANLSTRPPT